MFDHIGQKIALVVLIGCLAIPFGFELQEAASYKASHQTQTGQSHPKKKTDDVVVAEKADDKIARYTRWLAMLTGGLVLVSAVQIFFLIRADKTARIMAETARAQTDKMAEWADAAEKQMLLTGQQADIQKKQHAIGRLQFLATQRPKLRIRHVTLYETAGDVLGFIPWDHGDEIKGSLIVVNAGGTKATIVESRYRIYFSTDGLPAGQSPYETSFHNLLIPDQELDVGESCTIPLKDKIEMPGDRAPTEDMHTLRRFEQENWSVYVMGQIRYRDEGGAERFMGFCRKRMRNGRYRPVKSPDYEYED